MLFSTIINKQAVELVQKDSIIKVQSDSLNILKIRWNDAQNSQNTYQGIALGNQNTLINEIESLNNVINAYKNQVNSLQSEYNKVKKENFVKFISVYIIPYLSSMNETSDVIVHGSDQIWRKQKALGTYNPFYFGENNIKTKQHISYHKY